MVQLNCEYSRSISKEGDPLWFVSLLTCRSLRFRPVALVWIVLILLAPLFAPAKALAGPMVVGGTANPARAWNAAHTLYVDALPVSTTIPWSLDQTTPEVIQLAMNAQLKAAGQQPNWPIPVYGSSFNVTFTVNAPPNSSNYQAVDFNTLPAPYTKNKAGQYCT